jgi:glycosyltransferase involved in cell wall biosynthesis
VSGRVFTVNTTDVGGGAERIAKACADHYRSRGWESWFVVGNKQSRDEHVLPIWDNPHRDRRAYMARWPHRRRMAVKALSPVLGLEDHEFPHSYELLRLVGEPPDIVHIHNLHGPYFDVRALPVISRQVPVVVSMHDSWLLTGHCAHPGACARWSTGCGRCPDLMTTPAVRRDATRINLRRKQRALDGAQLHIACPSNAMIDRVERSRIASAVAEVRHIPYGIDTATFTPGDRAAARRSLGVAPEDVLFVFVAKDADANGYKLPGVVEAAAAAAAQELRRPARLVILGTTGAIRRQGALTTERRGMAPPAEVVDWLRAADAMLHAATDETYALVLVEALATGTPVVATDVGGVAEATAGFARLVPRDDVRAMAAAAAATVRDRQPTAVDAIEFVRRRNDLDTMVDAYLGWFDELRSRR